MGFGSFGVAKGQVNASSLTPEQKDANVTLGSMKLNYPRMSPIPNLTAYHYSMKLSLYDSYMQHRY